MRPKPPALHDEGFPALLAHQDDRHAALQSIDVEEHSMFTKEPQLSLGHRIGTARLHLPRLGQGIRRKSPRRLLQQGATWLGAEGAQVVDDRLLEQNVPPRHAQDYTRPEFWSSIAVIERREGWETCHGLLREILNAEAETCQCVRRDTAGSASRGFVETPLEALERVTGAGRTTRAA